MTPIRLLIVAGALVALIASAAPAAHARTACVDDILDEWVHPSKPIATDHKLKCYDLALTEAPEDVLLYTNFESEVRAAKQAAIRKNRRGTQTGTASPPAPAPQPAGSPPTPPPPPPAAPIEPPDVVEPDLSEEQPLIIDSEQPPGDAPDGVVADPLGVDEAPLVEDVLPIDEPVEIPPAASEAVDAPVIDALRNIGPNDARSVPVPLIVLTILCGLLAIIGATLLAARHIQSKRLAEGPPLPPRRRVSAAEADDI